MKEEIIVSGFGGQGIMSLGRLIAYAGMTEDKEVSWIPSYGPEMRGGTANCTVIVSDKRIPSPFSSNPDTIMVMNLPSLDKFLPQVKKGGTVIVNSSLIDKKIEREDINIFKIPANDIARNLGSNKIANMVMLGVYLAVKKTINIEAVKQALEKVLTERNHDLIPVNKKALDEGKKFVKTNK